MKFENKWNGRRLGSFNVEPYLKSIYGENISVKKVSSFKLCNVKPLLQNDYGDDFDCSITSIATCILRYAPSLKDIDVYNIVAEYGKSKSFYNGKKKPVDTANTLDDAIRIKSSYERADRITYIVYDTVTGKRIY